MKSGLDLLILIKLDQLNTELNSEINISYLTYLEVEEKLLEKIDMALLGLRYSLSEVDKQLDKENKEC